MRNALLVVVLMLPACGGGSKPKSTAGPGETGSVTANSDDLATCLAAREMLWECKDDYLPMLLDIRIALDFPAGVADRSQTPEGREELLSAASVEMPDYYTEEANQRICKQGIANAPADLRAMTPVAKSCLAQPDCATKIACWQPIEQKIREGQKAEAARAAEGPPPG